MNRLALALPFLAASLAHADPRLWIDAYGGSHLDEKAGLSLYEDNLLAPDQYASVSLDPETKPVAGVRLRLEAEPLPFGLAADLGFRRSRIPEADLDLMPFTIGVTLPSTLTLARFEGGGSLHPRGLLGFTATGVDGNVRIGGIRGEITDNTWGASDGRAGMTAALGLEWRPLPAFAVFTEYRYELLRFHLEHTDDDTLPTRNLETTGRIESETVLVGFSIRLLDARPARAARPVVPVPDPDSGSGNAADAADGSTAEATPAP